MTGPQFDMGIIGDASEMMIELAIEQYEQEKKARKILEVMKEYH